VDVAKAQPVGGGDPTPMNPVLCANLFNPPSPSNAQLLCTWQSPNPPKQVALSGENSTWIPPNTVPLPWQPFRQPAIMIQFFNGSHQLDPMGLDWWWGRFERVTDAGVNLGDSPVKADTNEDIATLVFNLNTGEPRDLDTVLGSNGKPDRWEAFEWYLNEYYDNYGYRRFILKLPAGAVGRQDFVVNQWQLLPAWKQDLFLNPNSPFNVWRSEHPDAVFEVYLGGPIPLGLCTPCFKANTFSYPITSPPAPPYPPLNGIAADTVSTSNLERLWRVSCPNVPTAEQFVPWNQRHVDLMIQSIDPWLDANIKGIWLDAMSENEPATTRPNAARRRGLLELAYAPYLRFRGARVGAETFPDRYINNGGNADWIDDCAVAYTRWFGLSKVATTWTATAPPGQRRQFKPENQGWFFNRSNSEVLLAAVAVRETGRMEDPYTSAEIGEARRRGFVIVQYNVSSDKQPVGEFVKRWYSMGKIRVADFDGNGAVVTDPNHPDHDLSKFQAAFNAAIVNPAALKVFANGDIDGDGDIDQSDKYIFEDYYWPRALLGVFDRPDFGGPNDL
jgi:hypothetical protein